ncbi:hypothetical protein EC957_009785 [Mortierella hygrophila]|uniref:Uncharacterized protein n=1 Tax=Mortierella hygrophila TaxID=979708 RepID=A0A9P6FBN9_9FUNG|nr:hypothetical protein EC957_009785 [Mortierella hygrophila]
MKLHYRKLPQTIRTKMEKLEFDLTLLPKVEQEAEVKPGDDAAPCFCTQSKMTDSFTDIKEEELMCILWGRVPGQVGLIWSGSSHTHDWANLQVYTSFGNLVKMLFIGEQNTVRLANKQQTTYGKRSATMSELKAAHPTIYDQGPLHDT